MMYLLDVNVFIEAKNRYYAFDICPGFWDWVDKVIITKDILSIDKVYDELHKSNDELSEWIKKRKSSGLFSPTDDVETQRNLKNVVSFVQKEKYIDSAKRKFFSGADPWLIAKAITIGATIVTHEVANPEAKSRIPIPNICGMLNIPFVNTFNMLRRHKASFTLQ